MVHQSILWNSNSTNEASVSWLVAGGRNVGFRVISSLALVAWGVSCCRGGGGPENVFLLVNSNSQDSMTVANYYVDIRDIPASNVLYLPYEGSRTEVSGATFRNQILSPAFAEIKKRDLTKQIDYLVYSCDFPWRILFKSDFPNEKFPKQLAPRGSLTGLTYLSAFVDANRKELVSPNSNLYYLATERGITISRAFRSRYRWAQGGRRSGASGISYMISSMLGVTDVRGNKVSEIVNCLRRSRQADGTKPAGTVYYMKHNGPRSLPRHDHFAESAASLRSSGVEAQILQGKFPSNRPSIAGLTAGVAYARLNKSGCRFLPGAFCDNLTSYGARFGKYLPPINAKTGKKSIYQTTVADFVRHGATGASGTVVEPYSLPQKFPHPSVHVHYAHGCSLGEAFYQSVSGPYQQLLVGDPLCQPWASIPDVEIEGVRQNALVEGRVLIVPTSKVSKGDTIKQFELFVDGKSIASCRPGEKLILDTTKFEDGYHELRIVATTDSPIETQGGRIVGVRVKNGTDAIGLRSRDSRISVTSKEFEVRVVSTRDSPIDLKCNGKTIGSIASGSGTLSLATEKFGLGPVEIFATGSGLVSNPLRLEFSAE